MSAMLINEGLNLQPGKPGPTSGADKPQEVQLLRGNSSNVRSCHNPWTWCWYKKMCARDKNKKSYKYIWDIKRRTGANHENNNL